MERRAGGLTFELTGNQGREMTLKDEQLPAAPGFPVERMVSGRAPKRDQPGDGKRRKERSQAARAAQGYDPKPPRCSECAEFVPCGNFRGMFRPPICGIGGFKAEPAGVCDLWRGTNGDVLDTPRNKETT